MIIIKKYRYDKNMKTSRMRNLMRIKVGYKRKFVGLFYEKKPSFRSDICTPP